MQVLNRSDPSRGHQGPAAFLIMASGLDDHGVDSKTPLSYSHIDIAGSSGKFPGKLKNLLLKTYFKKLIFFHIGKSHF